VFIQLVADTRGDKSVEVHLVGFEIWCGLQGTGDNPRAAMAPSATHSAVKSIGVGIVGAGWMGQVHAASWVANAPCGAIVAIADVSEPRARALSNEYTRDNARVYADLDRLLADPAVDAVDICLPHYLHADAIERAAGAGKHIFCEKPLCLSFEEARSVKLAIESANVILMCATTTSSSCRSSRRRCAGAGVLPRVVRGRPQHRVALPPTPGKAGSGRGHLQLAA
jgi:hypothetical protein